MIDGKTALFTIEEAGEILGSRLEGDSGFHSTSINNIRTDSREVHPGDLFVAVQGHRFDGHDFVESAFKAGAVAAVVSKQEVDKRNLQDSRLIIVDDTVFALGELARYHRSRSGAVVVAVTGSNGKTTVKNLIHEIASVDGRSLKSERNYNNFFGLPLSIFQLRAGHKWAVFELGMSARGEISRLAEIASPEIAVITNVGPVHLEFFKDTNEIADAKMEIVARIRPGGALVINGDDRLLSVRIPAGDFDIIKFGLGPENDVYPVDLSFDAAQCPSFQIGSTRIKSRLPGVHNVYNILAAYAVARRMNLDSRIIAEAIAEFKPSEMRSEIIEKAGVIMILDCYNANPVSMKYALDTLAKMKCGGRRIAVLADMLELGEDSRAFHDEIGEYGSGLKIDRLYCFGPLAKFMAAAFGKGAFHFEKKKELIDDLQAYIRPGDVVLFKGSRGMALEEVADEIIEAL
jgi:UDP-N-acetylmuramoyl-tripeptide--D-alanyl-D-alanine ligase